MVFTLPIPIPESPNSKINKIKSLIKENNNLKKIISDLNNSSNQQIFRKLQDDYQTLINHRTALHKQLDDCVKTIDYQNKEIIIFANQRDSTLKELEYYKKQLELLKSDKKYDDKLIEKINYFKKQIKTLKSDNNNLQFENAAYQNYENLYNSLKEEHETIVFELDEKKLDNEEQKTMISNLKIYNNTLQNKLNDTIDKNIDLKVEIDNINTKYKDIANEFIEMDKFIQAQDKTLSEQKKINDKLFKSQTKIEEELQFKLDEQLLQFRLKELQQEQDQDQEQEQEQEQELEQEQEQELEQELDQFEELKSESTYIYPQEDFYVIDIDKELNN